MYYTSAETFDLIKKAYNRKKYAWAGAFICLFLFIIIVISSGNDVIALLSLAGIVSLAYYGYISAKKARQVFADSLFVPMWKKDYPDCEYIAIIKGEREIHKYEEERTDLHRVWKYINRYDTLTDVFVSNNVDDFYFYTQRHAEPKEDRNISYSGEYYCYSYLSFRQNNNLSERDRITINCEAGAIKVSTNGYDAKYDFLSNESKEKLVNIWKAYGDYTFAIYGNDISFSTSKEGIFTCCPKTIDNMSFNEIEQHAKMQYRNVLSLKEDMAYIVTHTVFKIEPIIGDGTYIYKER